jgi:hypothetical protein
LLDEALQGTFPASDPIAITVDKPSKDIAPNGDHSPDGPSMAAGSPELVVSLAPPVVDLFDANPSNLVLLRLVVLPAWRSKIGQAAALGERVQSRLLPIRGLPDGNSRGLAKQVIRTSCLGLGELHAFFG